MRNKNEDTNKVILGAIIGAIIGGSALYLLHRNGNQPLMNKVGRAISEMGDALEESHIDDADEALDEIEKSIPKGDNVVNNVLTWVATGLSLWKRFNRGNL